MAPGGPGSRGRPVPIRALRTGLLLVMLALPAGGQALTFDVRASNFTPAEVAVIEAAGALWEAPIRDPFVVEIDIEKRSLPGSVLAVSREFLAGIDGRPSQGTVDIADLAGEPSGWFVDPTPTTSEEFEPGTYPWVSVAPDGGPAFAMLDLLTVVTHELGHVLGFAAAYPALAEHLEPTPSGRRTFVGPNVTATFTAAGQGTHLEGLAHPLDLMTSLSERGERRTPSRVDLLVLADAFGYTVDPPPPFDGPPVEVPDSPSSVLLVSGLLLLALVHRWRPTTS